MATLHYEESGRGLPVVLLHSIKGFRDRKKAVREVIDHLRAIEVQYRRAAEHIVQRDYGLKRIRTPIPDEVAERFFQLAQHTVDTYV